MKENEAMENLAIINLTLSQSLTQAQETILVPSKQLQTLQAQMNSKEPMTKKRKLTRKIPQ